jgi:hypothetical protein
MTDFIVGMVVYFLGLRIALLKHILLFMIDMYGMNSLELPLCGFGFSPVVIASEN